MAIASIYSGLKHYPRFKKSFNNCGIIAFGSEESRTIKLENITIFEEHYTEEDYYYKGKKYKGKKFVERFAEIDNTWRLPIKQRVIIHLRLLRLLKQGFTVQEALCRLKKQ